MKSNLDSKDYIANYELNDYRYDQFWKDREYEHLAEYNLLLKIFSKYLPDLNRRRIMDIGGAFGRLAPLYAHTSKETVMADYSTKELRAGMTGLKSTYGKKIKYIALNAYKLPFSDKSIDAILSVRVMHHLKDTELLFNELYRVLSPGGVSVIEFANKNHILAIFRNIFRLKKYLNKDLLKVGHKAEQSQGMEEGQESIMYNFSLNHVKNIALQLGFDVKGVYSCSFLRSRLLKKIFPTKFLLALEKILLSTINFLHVTPSLFIIFRKPGVYTDKNRELEDLLACPKCKARLVLDKNSYVCEKKHEFIQNKESILDLRDPRPEKINF